MVGILVTFTIWFVCTLPVAYEVLCFLSRGRSGGTKSIDVVLARTLFWFFGHPLVYFWLLPAYVMFYVMLPKIVGGKLFSDSAGRMAFMLFLVLSSPVGLHHQFCRPRNRLKLQVAAYAPDFRRCDSEFCHGVYGGRFDGARAVSRGAHGLFGWWKHLPYLDRDLLVVCVSLLRSGSLFLRRHHGHINASGNMDLTVHILPGSRPTFTPRWRVQCFLSFIGMSLFLLCQFRGVKVPFPRANVWTPWLWLLGVSIFSTGLSVAGMLGEPRRTNLV